MHRYAHRQFVLIRNVYPEALAVICGWARGVWQLTSHSLLGFIGGAGLVLISPRFSAMMLGWVMER